MDQTSLSPHCPKAPLAPRFAFILALALCISPHISSAQEPSTMQPPPLEESLSSEISASAQGEAQETSPQALTGAVPVDPDAFNPAEYNSLVFTYWELTAIEDARNSRGDVRGVEDYELTRAMKEGPADPLPHPPPEERDISLGGILYHGQSEWTIWLNAKRVTPKALPEEVLDLRVYNEYIEVKWYDKYTNQIFPIRLRPHQRFNIDTRMFLPG